MSTAQGIETTTKSLLNINFYKLNIDVNDRVTIKWENRNVYSSVPYSSINLTDKIALALLINVGTISIYGLAFRVINIIPTIADLSIISDLLPLSLITTMHILSKLENHCSQRKDTGKNPIAINFYKLNVEFYENVTVKWENQIVYSSGPYTSINAFATCVLMNLGTISIVKFAYWTVNATPKIEVLLDTVLYTQIAWTILNVVFIVSTLQKLIDDINKLIRDINGTSHPK